MMKNKNNQYTRSYIRLRKEGNESYIRSENAFLQAEVDNLYRHIHKMNLYTARLEEKLGLKTNFTIEEVHE